MLLINPRLCGLIKDAIGDGWVKDLEELRKLEAFAEDPAFQKSWRRAKQQNKSDLARFIQKTTGVTIDPATMFDVQAKRIHEYKRQHLNLLHVVTLYNRIKKNPAEDITPRTVLFSGKAAPGYFMAKLIIKLINSVAATINNDPDVNQKLKMVFMPDFNVKNAQHLYPAVDLSEQISTAGKEASGTGNMKMALNGAVTIGTLDGANIEIRDEVGIENFFLFGFTAEEVASLRRSSYRPRAVYESNTELREAIDLIASGAFSPNTPSLFHALVGSLLEYDPFMLLADYDSYVRRQEEVGRAYRDVSRWTRMSILNVARMGKFSSDRSIREYCRDIWNIAF